MEAGGSLHAIRPGEILRLQGIEGDLYIRGSGLSLTIEGLQLDLSTVGKGSVCLRGVGRVRRQRLQPEAVSFHAAELYRFAGHGIG